MTKQQQKFWLSVITTTFAFIIVLFGGWDEGLAPKIDPADSQDENMILLQEGSVVRVVDGDTIVVMIEGREEKVRFIGMNTPETVDPRKEVECFGKEASAHMNDLVSGRVVSLVEDVSQDNMDRYGRFLRYVELNGEDIALRMILDGYAYEYTYQTPYDRQQEYKAAESEARASRAGLWSEATCNGKL